ncbi:MAG: hypothetical protein WAX89_06765 [Alphaproteobacteria bacterium]
MRIHKKTNQQGKKKMTNVILPSEAIDATLKTIDEKIELARRMRDKGELSDEACKAIIQENSPILTRLRFELDAALAREAEEAELLALIEAEAGADKADKELVDA